MKKIIAKVIFITLFSIVGMGRPNKINAAPEEDPCYPIVVVCPDGHLAGYAIICSMEDLKVWRELLCGANPN